MSLEIYREQLDEIDSGVLGLLQRRLGVVALVSEHKKANGLEVYVPEREKEMLERLGNLGEEYGLDKAFVQGLFAAIIEYYKGLE